MTIAQQQAFLIKGYLMAKDAPPQILSAIELIIENTGTLIYKAPDPISGDTYLRRNNEKKK
jgi:hypothetical protein